MTDPKEKPWIPELSFLANNTPHMRSLMVAGYTTPRERHLKAHTRALLERASPEKLGLEKGCNQEPVREGEVTTGKGKRRKSQAGVKGRLAFVSLSEWRTVDCPAHLVFLNFVKHGWEGT